MVTPAHTPNQQVETLTQINVQDMLDNFGLGQLQRGRALRALLQALCTPAARILARQVAHFDQRVGQVGLQAGGRELLRRYVYRLEVIGAEHVPLSGGVLFAANHPGMTDTIACFSSIARPDLHVVSADRPFIRALTNVSQRIFYVSEQPGERLRVVRQIARFLQSGGAVLLCPAGQIEPDPAVMPGACESLATWSESLGLFVRLAPNSLVVPTIISGVIYGPSLHNPLTRLRRAQKERERIAATVQAFLLTIGHLRRHMTVRVEFGAPLRAAELASRGDAVAITNAITHAVRQIMPPTTNPNL